MAEIYLKITLGVTQWIKQDFWKIQPRKQGQTLTLNTLRWKNGNAA